MVLQRYWYTEYKHACSENNDSYTLTGHYISYTKLVCGWSPFLISELPNFFMA